MILSFCIATEIYHQFFSFLLGISKKWISHYMIPVTYVHKPLHITWALAGIRHALVFFWFIFNMVIISVFIFWVLKILVCVAGYEWYILCSGEIMCIHPLLLTLPNGTCALWNNPKLTMCINSSRVLLQALNTSIWCFLNGVSLWF